MFVLRIISACFVLATSPAVAIEISGSARITDGDTIVVGRQVIRIAGIDAFEDGQPQGKGATNAMRALVASGVRCSGEAYDNYERLIATCYSNGIDIGEAQVEAGHALAYRRYSSAYIETEDRARAAKVGAWHKSFVAPWDFRAQRWESASQEAPDPDCPIKGNISGNGHIYHAPWSRWYSRTKINTAKGERWFCDEAQALAAGWRAPLR